MKINHKIFLLILPLISFFYLSPEVYAHTGNFTIQLPGTRTGNNHSYTCISYDKTSLEIKNEDTYSAWASHADSEAGNCDVPYIHVMWENKDGGKYVYCSDKGDKFRGSNDYRLDGNYAYSKQLGYIIQAAWEKAKKEELSDPKSWFSAQAAVWAYMKKESIYRSNLNEYDSINQKTKDIVELGLQNYKKAENNNISNSTDDSAEFIVDVEDNDENLRFIPENDSCGQGGGNYTTRKITITNVTDHEIEINLNINNSNVSAYDTTDNKKIDGTISLDSYNHHNNKIEIKLKTSNKLADPGITLTITSRYNKTIKENKPSTQRYVTNSNDEKVYQGILTYSVENKDTTNTYTHTDTRSFKQIGLTHKTCDDYNNDKEAKGSNTKNEAETKMCASNSKSNPPKASDYTVKFAACKCQKLDLGDGKVVRILLKEGVGFRFGSLTPTTVYPGGSFKLNNDPSNGITTGYKSVITWEYADWVEDGNYPYYYNPDNLDNDNANKLAEEISEKIKEEVLNKEISLQFESKDSNDEKEQKNTVVPVTLSIENIQYDNEKKKFTLDYNNGIQLNDSYFSVDGEVKYKKDNNTHHTIEGGKEYYIPLHYLEKTFPFNIKETNLSALKDGNFWYQADCDVEVNTDNYLYDKENGIRYRSITVSKPFPKATKKSDLPFNWKEWYWESTSNQQRIKDSYKNYPNQPLYKITVDNERITKIRNITDSYNSWSNIKSNGSSKFVVGEVNYFNTRANDTSSSYCPIGKFSDTCDK